MFHKDIIFNDANKSWEKYKNDPCYFQFPERITIEPTNRCNLECFMCPRNNVEMELGDIELSLFKKIVDEASQFLPVCLVSFFRGESLLHPRFLEMLSYAKEKGLKPIQFATNACFLSRESAEVILDLDIDFISFSIDVNNPEIYEKIRKHSNYKKVFGNIIFFLEEKKKRNKSLPETQVSAVKTDQNVDFIEDFVSFWRPKVDRVRVYDAHSLDGRLGQSQENDKAGKRLPCLKPLTDMVIYWNGDVAVCNHDWARKEFIGNVKDDTIKAIWSNANYQRIRKRQINGSYPNNSVCKDCDQWKAYYVENQIIGNVYV